MKKFPLFLAAAASALTMSLSAQTVFTTPAGYVTLHADAATSATEPKNTFISQSLARELLFSGSVTSAGTASITITNAAWTANEFAAPPEPTFALIKGTNFEGEFFTITSNTTDTLTLDTSEDLSSIAAQNISIYKHSTLASIFGADPTVNGVKGGATVSDADEVLISSPSSGFTTFYYKNVANPFIPGDTIGWKSTSTGTNDASNSIIAPNAGVIYVRKDTSDLDVTVFGEVIDGSIFVPIRTGFNLVAVPYPVTTGLTLGNSGLFPTNEADYDVNSHLQPGGIVADAETILIWNGSGYDTFFYKNATNPFIPGDMKGWVNTSDTTTPVPNTPLNGGFFIERKTGNPSLNWMFDSIVQNP